MDFILSESSNEKKAGLTEEIREFLYEKGARLVGIGTMHGIKNCTYSGGIAIAIPLPQSITYSLQNAPTKEYRELYFSMNQTLNEIVLQGEQFLKRYGFDAYAQTTDRVVVDEDQRSQIPHKTVAACAGLGWVGKNNLLVTREFGSAIRLSSLLTNAPLAYNAPVTGSSCGGCSLCVQECPAHALKGTLWKPGIPRECMVDIEACYKKQREIMYKHTGIDTDLCGKCFAVCAYTKKYLSVSQQTNTIL